MADFIFRRIAAPANLAAAWQRVRRNGGGPGLDGVDIEAFAADAERRIAGLSRGLFAGLYRPRRLLKVEIAKPTGGTHRLAVPALIDRIAQVAATVVLDERIDPTRASPIDAAAPSATPSDAAIAALSALIDPSVDDVRFYRVPANPFGAWQGRMLAPPSLLFVTEPAATLTALVRRPFWRQPE